MRAVLLCLCWLPGLVFAQSKDTAHAPKVNYNFPEGYISFGLVNELWVLANHLPAGYTSFTYRGPGSYIGGGFISANPNARLLGYGAGIDYFQYNMSRSISEVAHAHTNYGYVRIAPAVYFYPKIKSRLRFNFCGTVSYMNPMQPNERSYMQLGIKGSIGFKAYEGNLGYNYSPTPTAPSTDIVTRGWHEQMFTLGFAVYPGRIAAVKKYRTKRIIKWAKP